MRWSAKRRWTISIRAEYDLFNRTELSLRAERLQRVKRRSLMLSMSCILIALGGAVVWRFT